MISEESDWSNDVENSALHHRNKLQFKIYWNTKHVTFKKIFHNINVFTDFL